MKSARVLFATVLLFLTQTPASSQNVGNGVAAGQLRGPNGSPAAGVRISATTVPDARAPNVALVSIAVTDQDGRFRLENIPPGRYLIQAGFIDSPTYYPGVVSTDSAAPVAIGPGAVVAGLDFTTRRPTGGRIAGRISLNLNPKPTIVGLRDISNGLVVQAPIGPDGSFAFSRLAPGDYALAANPANSILPALTVAVNDRDVAVGLPSGPRFKVSGSVGFGPHSLRRAGQRVILSGALPWAQLEAVTSPSGEFEFPSVPAGEYSVRTVPGSFLDAAKLTVSDRDIRAFAVPSAVELNGRIALDDGSPLPPLPLALMIYAAGANAVSIATAPAANGSFKLPLNEGEYRISIGNLPAELSLKSASYGAADLVTRSLKLDGLTDPLEIRILLGKAK